MHVLLCQCTSEMHSPLSKHKKENIFHGQLEANTFNKKINKCKYKSRQQLWPEANCFSVSPLLLPWPTPEHTCPNDYLVYLWARESMRCNISMGKILVFSYSSFKILKVRAKERCLQTVALGQPLAGNYVRKFS